MSQRRRVSTEKAATTGSLAPPNRSSVPSLSAAHDAQASGGQGWDLGPGGGGGQPEVGST